MYSKEYTGCLIHLFNTGILLQKMFWLTVIIRPKIPQMHQNFLFNLSAEAQVLDLKMKLKKASLGVRSPYHKRYLQLRLISSKTKDKKVNWPICDTKKRNHKFTNWRIQIQFREPFKTPSVMVNYFFFITLKNILSLEFSF